MWRCSDHIHEVKTQKGVCRVLTRQGVLLDVACLDDLPVPQKGDHMEVEVSEKLPSDLDPWQYVAHGQRVILGGAAAETLSCGGLLLTASPDTNADTGADTGKGKRKRKGTVKVLSWPDRWPPRAYVMAKWGH